MDDLFKYFGQLVFKDPVSHGIRIRIQSVLYNQPSSDLSLQNLRQRANLSREPSDSFSVLLRMLVTIPSRSIVCTCIFFERLSYVHLGLACSQSTKLLDEPCMQSPMRDDSQRYMSLDLGPVLVSGVTPQTQASQLLRIANSDDMHVFKSGCWQIWNLQFASYTAICYTMSLLC